MPDIGWKMKAFVDSLESGRRIRIRSDSERIGVIAKLKEHERPQVPLTDLSELITESDVEQKLVYPFLVHSSFLDIPHEWVRTKEYMEPTEIDKRAGKRAGYIPDYSVWRSGFPLLVVEAKRPDEASRKDLKRHTCMRRA